MYNFVTCIVWAVEVFFNVLDYNGYFDCHCVEGEDSLLQPRVAEHVPNQRTTNDFLALSVEVALAIYFFADSTIVAVHLSNELMHERQMV